jgi:hypothetical protein
MHPLIVKVQNTMPRSTSVLLYIALALYALSLILPGFVVNFPTYAYAPSWQILTTYEPQNAMGYDLFLTGWAGIFILQFAWWANPLAFLVLIFSTSGVRKTALALSVSSFLLALQTYLLHNVPTSPGSVDCDLDIRLRAPPYCGTVDHLAIGYYLWLASILMLVVYCALQTQKARREKMTPVVNSTSR